MAQAEVAQAAPGGQGQGGQGGEEQGGMRGHIMRFMFQLILITTVMNFMGNRNKPKSSNVTDASPGSPGAPKPGSMRNLFGPSEECDLFVHLTNLSWTPRTSSGPSLAALWSNAQAAEEGLELLWQQRVWYEAGTEVISINVSIPPLAREVLSGEHPGPYILATLVRVSEGPDAEEDHVVRQHLPLIARLRELNLESGTANLFSDEEQPVKKKNLSSPKLPYFKTKIEARPVCDQTVHSLASIQQGPFRKLDGFPELGFYKPYLYLSDFWMLEKDYLPLNSTLESQRLNITLSYSVITALTWSLQSQMSEQWSVQGEWGITDTQRDSFMLKRLCIDTNPYLLAFSGCFLLMHTLFSLLAFKNDIQFWRKNESMQGLSARSMVVSFICQFITTLYLLDSQETSRLILFNICLDTALATWKLRKAVKVGFKPSFPFISLEGQKGYENKGTNKYDEEALRYMLSILAPLFIGYSLRSLFHGKHRGWYSFLVGSAAGGVYTFGFAMMTPQLYINYKLQSVEHLPWRALTYKAMNTFVDDIAALLIDMPMMHRLSCFRDDVVFFIYLYQRWKYRVDKARPSMWVQQPEVVDDAQTPEVADAAPVGEESADTSAEAAPSDAAPDPQGGDAHLGAAPEEAEGVRQRR